MIMTSKIATAIAWLAILLNWIVPTVFAGFDPSISNGLHWAGIFLIGAHAIETLVFLPKAKASGGNIANHIIQLLLFGYVYNMELDSKQKGNLP